MILRAILVFLLLIQIVSAKILKDYHCGIGPTTKVISYVISLPCGREKLNNCCFYHDRCYDCKYGEENRVLKACDSEFESCIEQSYIENSWICRKLLKFTHSGAIKLFGSIYRNVFGYNPMSEIMQMDTEDSKNGTRQFTRAERSQENEQNSTQIIELTTIPSPFNCSIFDRDPFI